MWLQIYVEKYLLSLKVTVPNIGKGNQAKIRIDLQGQWKIWTYGFKREVEIFIFSSQLKRNDKWGGVTGSSEVQLWIWLLVLKITLKSNFSYKANVEGKTNYGFSFLRDANTSGSPWSCWWCSIQEAILYSAAPPLWSSQILLWGGNLQG